MIILRKLTNIIILIFLFVSCNTVTKESHIEQITSSNTDEIKRDVSRKKPIVSKPDLTQEMADKLPIHGKISKEKLALYFPGITDTIKDLRIIGSEKINLKTKNGIIVSLLHNTGTFDQMILCTHDNSLTLIDNLYIGKATGFDGTNHTIEYSITSDNHLKFEEVDWKFFKNGKSEDIDTVNYKSYLISVDKKGKIRKKKYAALR